jgi:hypothetical protein
MHALVGNTDLIDTAQSSRGGGANTKFKSPYILVQYLAKRPNCQHFGGTRVVCLRFERVYLASIIGGTRASYLCYELSNTVCKKWPRREYREKNAINLVTGDPQQK